MVNLYLTNNDTTITVEYADQIRDCFISVDDIKAIADAKFGGNMEKAVKDIELNFDTEIVDDAIYENIETALNNAIESCKSEINDK